MQVLLDLFRSAEGRIEGVVVVPGSGGRPFAGVLDLLRVLEGIELPVRCEGPTERGAEDV